MWKEKPKEKEEPLRGLPRLTTLSVSLIAPPHQESFSPSGEYALTRGWRKFSPQPKSINASGCPRKAPKIEI